MVSRGEGLEAADRCGDLGGHGQRAAMRSRRRRPVETMRAAALNGRSRIRLGSHRRAGAGMTAVSL
jgi:hypothetical protein